MLYQATAVISCFINIGLKSVKGTNAGIRKAEIKEQCQTRSFSLQCSTVFFGLKDIFSTMPEIATPVLFLTIEKCNSDCNSGSFLDVYGETSMEFNAFRENYRNKTISPKYTFIAVGIQQYFWVGAEVKNLGFESVGI